MLNIILTILFGGLAILRLFLQTNSQISYKIAKESFDEKNMHRAMLRIARSVKLKKKGKYSCNQAKRVINSLTLLLAICTELHIDKTLIINPILSKFKLISTEGGFVDYDSTKNLRDLMADISLTPYYLAKNEPNVYGEELKSYYERLKEDAASTVL